MVPLKVLLQHIFKSPIKKKILGAEYQQKDAVLDLLYDTMKTKNRNINLTPNLYLTVMMLS